LVEDNQGKKRQGETQIWSNFDANLSFQYLLKLNVLLTSLSFRNLTLFYDQTGDSGAVFSLLCRYLSCLPSFLHWEDNFNAGLFNCQALPYSRGVNTCGTCSEDEQALKDFI
jgi:hypothetical protein